MSLKGGLITYLNAQTPVTAVVSTRIRANRALQSDSEPFILIRVLEDRGDTHAGGASGLHRATVEIACHGKTQLQADDLAEIVRKEVHGFQGTWDTDTIRAAIDPVIRDANELDLQGGQVGKHISIVEVEVWHNLTIPSP